VLVRAVDDLDLPLVPAVLELALDLPDPTGSHVREGV
jgi:hypothetical protein